MVRQIANYTYEITNLPFGGDLKDWLRNQVEVESWLLVHALDGVIWGYTTPDVLVTSHDVLSDESPPLRLETLQYARLFNPNYEVKLWRSKDQWHAVRITDYELPDGELGVIEEQHLLWGTYAEPLKDGFIRLEDGAQGLVHIVPPFDGSEDLAGELGRRSDPVIKRVCIGVRHYLTEDALGVNSISLTRFMKLGVEKYG